MATAEEAKADYIKIMGEEQGAIYNALWQELSSLYSFWNEHKKLVHTKKSRIEILNEAAPDFFGRYQYLLYRHTVLTIANLTGSAKSAGKENLSIRCFKDFDLDKEPQEQLNKKVDEVVSKSTSFESHRNKRLAHLDRRLKLEPKLAEDLPQIEFTVVEEMLEEIASLLNYVSNSFKMGTTLFGSCIEPLGGAENLMYVLADGLFYKAELGRSIRNGDEVTTRKHIYRDKI